MALCSYVVDLIRLGRLDNTNQRAGVRHISIVKVYRPIPLHITHPFFEIEMLNASCIEG